MTNTTLRCHRRHICHCIPKNLLVIKMIINGVIEIAFEYMYTVLRLFKTVLNQSLIGAEFQTFFPCLGVICCTKFN